MAFASPGPPFGKVIELTKAALVPPPKLSSITAVSTPAPMLTMGLDAEAISQMRYAPSTWDVGDIVQVKPAKIVDVTKHTVPAGVAAGKATAKERVDMVPFTARSGFM